MTMLNTASSWNVGKTSGRCAACGLDLPPNTECWAALCDGEIPAQVTSPETPGKGKEAAVPPPFIRIDLCEKCWSQGIRPESLSTEHGKLDMFSFWKTTVPLPQQKKKLLVDDAVLLDVFQRMEGKNEPQEVRFRFVLALILMRKRLLKYEGMDPVADAARQEPAPKTQETPLFPPAPEVWRMLPRGENAVAVHVINPHLTADQITEVSQQLSAILAEEV